MIVVDCYNLIKSVETGMVLKLHDRVREDFKMFFHTREGELPWQLDYVQDNSKWKVN